MSTDQISSICNTYDRLRIEFGSAQCKRELINAKDVCLLNPDKVGSIITYFEHHSIRNFINTIETDTNLEFIKNFISDYTETFIHLTYDEHKSIDEHLTILHKIYKVLQYINTYQHDVLRLTFIMYFNKVDPQQLFDTTNYNFVERQLTSINVNGISCTTGYIPSLKEVSILCNKTIKCSIHVLDETTYKIHSIQRLTDYNVKKIEELLNYVLSLIDDYDNSKGKRGDYKSYINGELLSNGQGNESKLSELISRSVEMYTMPVRDCVNYYASGYAEIIKQVFDVYDNNVENTYLSDTNRRLTHENLYALINILIYLSDGIITPDSERSSRYKQLVPETLNILSSMFRKSNQ